MVTLNLDIVQTEQAVLVTFNGDGSAANAQVMEMAVTRLCALRPRTIVLDFANLKYIASLCMGCLVALRRSVTAHGGTVRIAAATDDVALALRRAKLDLIFPLDATVAESLAAGAERAAAHRARA